MQPPTVLHDAIIHDDVMIHALIGWAIRLADAHTAASEVMQVAMHDLRVRASVFEIDPVPSDMSNLAVLKANAAAVFDLDGSIGLRCGLAIVQTIGRIQVVPILKRDAFKMDLLRAFDQKLVQLGSIP
jgi:hypothetical protein